MNKTKLCYWPASPVHIFNVWTVDMQRSNIQEWNQITPKLHNVIYRNDVTISKLNAQKYIIKSAQV